MSEVTRGGEKGELFTGNHVTSQDFYVDEVLRECDDVTEAKKLQAALIVLIR
jgi:hypothetical protein